MSLNNFIPVLWSARLLNTLNNAHVFANVVNTDYEGEISAQGDQVKINSIGEVTISDYTKNSNLSDPEALDAVQTILEINQAKSFNFQVDDIDAAQQKPKVMDSAMQEAGWGLANEADKLIAGFYTSAHAEVEKDKIVDDEPENTYEVLAEAAEKLDEKNVPREGRWVVVPPFFNAGMVLAGLMETAGSASAEFEKANGYLTRLLGFDIWVSNNLTVSGGYTYGMAGSRKAISYAEQILDIEAYRPEKRFANAVKGLHVYGAKVVYPNALVRLKIKRDS